MADKGKQAERWLKAIGPDRRAVIEAQRHLDGDVLRARKAGATWESIGRALGMARQNAERKYAPLLGLSLGEINDKYGGPVRSTPVEVEMDYRAVLADHEEAQERKSGYRVTALNDRCKEGPVVHAAALAKARRQPVMLEDRVRFGRPSPIDCGCLVEVVDIEAVSALVAGDDGAAAIEAEMSLSTGALAPG